MEKVVVLAKPRVLTKYEIGAALPFGVIAIVTYTNGSLGLTDMSPLVAFPIEVIVWVDRIQLSPGAAGRVR